jgi:hypothetical protein
MSISLSGIRFVVSVVPKRAEADIASMGTVNGINYSDATISYRPSNITLCSKTAGKKTINLLW